MILAVKHAISCAYLKIISDKYTDKLKNVKRKENSSKLDERLMTESLLQTLLKGTVPARLDRPESDTIGKELIND